MWHKIKSGFAYGVGGAIGWRLGNWLVNVVLRLLLWIAGLVGVGFFATSGF